MTSASPPDPIRKAGRWLRWSLGYAPDFRGRLARLPAWLQILAIVAIWGCLGSAGLLFPAANSAQPHIAEAIAAILNICLPLIVLLSVLIRRMHDTGRYGFALLIVALPYGGPFILLYFLLADSQPETNIFGDPPT